MSVAYPISMATVLETMKVKALEDTTLLPFLQTVFIGMLGWSPNPTSDYTLYLMPIGSPETEESETTVHAAHRVMMEAVIRVSEPGDEGQIVGRDGANLGITEFVDRVLTFFSGNMLGLENAGLENGRPPFCQAPNNAYSVLPTEDYSLLIARMEYTAPTRPFVRTGA